MSTKVAQWGVDQSHGQLVRILGEKENSVSVNDGYRFYAIHVKHFLPMSLPPIVLADQVRIKSKPEQVGTVRGMTWHFKRGEFYYLLTINGKAKRKRYYASDIELTARADKSWDWFYGSERERQTWERQT
jgi:hypothetical protein